MEKKKWYLYPNIEEQMINEEKEDLRMVYGFDDSGVLKSKISGAKYHKTGYHSTDAMVAIRNAKRFLTVFSKLPTPKNLLWAYTNLYYRDIEPYVLKMQYRSPIAQELCFGVYASVLKWTKDIETSKRTALIISTIIDVDDAYRFRIQDVLTKTSKEKLLKRPVREVRKLTQLLIKRELGAVKWKYKILLFIAPLFRGKIKIAVREMDIERMKPTNEDIYWMCLKEDNYKYLGKTIEERKKLLENEPKPLTINL